jgi:hypothetical protein
VISFGQLILVPNLVASQIVQEQTLVLRITIFSKLLDFRIFFTKLDPKCLICIFEFLEQNLASTMNHAPSILWTLVEPLEVMLILVVVLLVVEDVQDL